MQLQLKRNINDVPIAFGSRVSFSALTTEFSSGVDRAGLGKVLLRRRTLTRLAASALTGLWVAVVSGRTDITMGTSRVFQAVLKIIIPRI